MVSKVTKIILTIDKKEIQLTPEEVRDLKAALEEMYPSPKVKEYIRTPYIPSYPKYRDDFWYEPAKWIATAGGVTLCAK